MPYQSGDVVSHIQNYIDSLLCGMLLKPTRLVDSQALLDELRV